MRNLSFAVVALLVVAASALEAVTSASPATHPHWSFQRPRPASVPVVKERRWVRNPIDAFVLAGLEKEGISPSPEADRPTLLRRLCLDLLGLSPTRQQRETFLRDPQPDAYDRLVDSLLASPHFGERWARHWLDLARYADSEGYQIDRPRPGAYVYRNWVIDAFNRDLPFDQFTIDQLAGDLIPNGTPEQKIATGFHRNTLMNWEDGVDAEEFRCKAKVDRVSTTGTAWLGLTIGCAQCHSHKYDPVSQREFFQLYAFFNQADEVELSAPQSNELLRHAQEKHRWENDMTRLKEQLAVCDATNESRLSELKKQVEAHEKAVPTYTPPNAQTFQENTNVRLTHLHIRGDFLRPGEEVQPGTLSVLHPFRPRGQRPDRLDLARWIVDPANPLTARVAVNHVWQHLFGRGLVGTPGDFGARGELPSHPDLLDWLALAFASATNLSDGTSQPAPLNWSRKGLIRLMVTSNTYRQSSHVRPELVERDPENILLARQNRFRLEAEIIRDLYLSAAGLLNAEIGGPSFHPRTTPDFKSLGSAGAFQWVDSTGPELYRRGLYIFSQRTVPYPTAMTFDQADACESCPRRGRSNTPLQALTLLNHGLFVECAQSMARRMSGSPCATTREKLEYGFTQCLGRPLVAEELVRIERLFQDELVLGRQDPKPAAEKADAAEAAAFFTVTQVLLNLDEFVTRE